MTNKFLKIVVADIIGNMLYKGYKEYCKFCWKKFYKGSISGR